MTNFSFIFLEEEHNESSRSGIRHGFMHSMKKHKDKKLQSSNISAEKVTSEATSQNDSTLQTVKIDKGEI